MWSVNDVRVERSVNGARGAERKDIKKNSLTGYAVERSVNDTHGAERVTETGE